MWYVIQVYTGHEELMKQLCQKRITDKEILTDCFIPYYEEEKKYLGQWHRARRVLFPGYFFVISDNVTALRHELLEISEFARILGDSEGFLPLTDDEIAFLCRFGGEDRIVGMSAGIIENDSVRIFAGPLKGLEGLIRKIDRHKRKATIAVHMCGREVEVRVGLEIVQKKE